MRRGVSQHYVLCSLRLLFKLKIIRLNNSVFTKTIAYIFLLFSIAFCACKTKPVAQKTLFTLMDSTGVLFTNTVRDTTDLNILNYRNFYNGGGAAIGDLNNDGLADIFFTANQTANKLYLNKGAFTFDDISEKAGFGNKKQWSTGVVLADINNDGWLDIYVSNAGNMNDSNLRRNQLFINNHNLTFTDSAAAYGLDDAGYTTQVSFFDFDLDGDLDCFMVNNSPISPNSLNLANYRDVPDDSLHLAAQWKGGGDHLYRNDNGHYAEISKQAGIHGSIISFGLGVTVGDVNGDGYPDVYVSNDYFERDYLYINQKNGTFKDEAEEWLQHTSLASMGADFGDINNDGYPDIFTTDMLPAEDFRKKTTLAFEDINMYRLKQKNGFYHQFFQNTLQLNNGNGKFADIANYAGVPATDWSWGGIMFDADNDGYTDLYVCNGIYHDLINQDFLDFTANDIMQEMTATGRKAELHTIINKMPSIHVLNKAYKNGGNLSFTDVGEAWGFTQPSFSNGAAYGDLDNDGDLDLIVNNVNQPAYIYRNNAQQYHQQNYLSISLQGSSHNRFAIGSTIKVYQGGQVLTREVIPSRGFQSSVDYKVIIGLGKTTQVDSMVVYWPDRSSSVYIHPRLNSTHAINEMQAQKRRPVSVKQTATDPMFTQLPTAFEKHEEDDYVDFFYERNVPAMVSGEGPKAATGDVNADGLEDVYIGGTASKPGQLYLQKGDGKFIQKDQPAFKAFTGFEDVAVLLFDSDQDKDLDLLICPGGNNMPPGSPQLQLRMFTNDGKGNFILDGAAFPANNANISVACAYDFDTDGDLDLFIGGRSVIREYGLTPASCLFVNDGHGHFSNIAKIRNPDISNIGMVTGAAWADVWGDAKKELVIVGEWMAPRIFSFQKDHFTEVKTNINHLYGWWQTVAVADVNGDGRQDLLMGNMGENFCLHPNEANPVKLWVADFDQNGTNDKVLTSTIEGKDKPVFLKHDLEESMPFLKKQNLRHQVYAGKTVQELMPPETLGKAIVKQFNYAASCVAINKGNGQFAIQKFPVTVQLSCVNAICTTDLNRDGFIDVLLGGNNFNFLPQLERLDAGMGDVLMNDGKGNFKRVEAKASGITLRGQVKDIVALGKNKSYLFLQNNAYPVLYKLNKKK